MELHANRHLLDHESGLLIYRLKGQRGITPAREDDLAIATDGLLIPFVPRSFPCVGTAKAKTHLRSEQYADL